LLTSKKKLIVALLPKREHKNLLDAMLLIRTIEPHPMESAQCSHFAKASALVFQEREERVDLEKDKTLLFLEMKLKKR
jgi:hypothetical protein